jgi:hypothetical protein
MMCSKSRRGIVTDRKQRSAYRITLDAPYVAMGGPADDKHLRNEIGHDLHRALDLAEDRGFQSQAPHLREFVERMSGPAL